jgi:hypothetical protein
LWGFVVGLCILLGLVAVITEQALTHQWWTKKTLLYTLLGSFFIIGGAVAYQMYGDELHNSVFQNLNAKHTQIVTRLPAGTAENPIQLCRSDTASLQAEALWSDEVTITFPVAGDRYSRDAVDLRVGGRHVEVMDDGTRVEELDRDVREMAEPLDLQKLLVSGLNRLHFYVTPSSDSTDVMVLVVRLLRSDTEQVLRISYLYGDRGNHNYPVTDIYFDLKPCIAR